MCALFGLLDCEKRVPMKVLQKLVQALANASEVRGKHASGIAYNYCGELKIYKRPRPAHRMHFRLPEGTTAVMGHTRFTTQGDQRHNCNNHPFRGYAGRSFALAHNGVLYNDTSLRREHNLPDTPIETDSYITVQLIESQHELNFDSLRFACETVRGSFTFTLLDETNTIYIIKGDSPMYLIYFPQYGLYVYTSTAEIMKDALRHLPQLQSYHEVVPVKDGEIVQISPDGEIKREAFTMHDDYCSLYRSYWYDWFPPAKKQSSDEDDYLIELCRYYGGDIETARYLLATGYSLDEIETMFSEPDEYGLWSLCGGEW